MADIALSASIRSNLFSLQKTSRLMEQTTNRLATGRKVSKAIDNPTNFFAAKSYTDRATSLSARLDGMGEAVQQIKAADNGITAIRGILSQMKGVANDALANTDPNERAALGAQFNELITQASTLARDSNYAGINLLNGGSRTVQFNEKNGGSELEIKGFTVEKDGDDLSFDDGVELTITAHGASRDWSADGDLLDADLDTAGNGVKDYIDIINTSVQEIEAVEQGLKLQASKMASNLAIITQREDFTIQQINVLQEGADKLTLADMNEEGANLLALQTAAQLGTQSLSLASQQSQQVLRILG